MDIGIIGAGHIGGSLTRRLAGLGHPVRVSNSRAPETLADLASETGATAVWAREAATDADLVIVSIPQKNVVDLEPGIVGGAKPGAPVIETNNYYPRERDGLIAAIEAGTPESVWVSEQLGVPVFKVFNGIFWKHLLEGGLPLGSTGRIALPVAGDDAARKRIVFDLVNELGFDPVDGGRLADSWRQQPGTPVYGADLDASAATGALSAASPERPEAFRAAG
jgi:predicted dinucleotide-binding enzyme